MVVGQLEMLLESLATSTHVLSTAAYAVLQPRIKELVLVDIF